MSTLIYDFETSGLNPYHDDIIEIGCRCLESDEVFTCLVQPLSDRILCDKVIELTGITNELFIEVIINFLSCLIILIGIYQLISIDFAY